MRRFLGTRMAAGSRRNQSRGRVADALGGMDRRRVSRRDSGGNEPYAPSAHRRGRAYRAKPDSRASAKKLAICNEASYGEVRRLGAWPQMQGGSRDV